MPSITTIPFSQLKFDDDLPTLQAVEERLTKTLRMIRTDLEERAELEGSDRIDNSPSFDDQIRDTDRAKIKRRATLYLVRAHTATGTYHLADKDKVKLAPLRDGLPVARVQTEHEADEIAAALHAEMPWMGPATEEVWHGLRASVRDGLPGLRFNPLVLVGSPGIGKSHWARRLAEHLTVPVTKIDASNEPATFSLVGVQRGWGSAAPGKLMATVLRERHAGPLVIIDEIEKTGDVNAVSGSRHTLTDALLPLLERMTAETWECPYFQVRVDMSWSNWVLTANSRMGLPEPLQSRCIVLDLPDLTAVQLSAYAEASGHRRGLLETALEAVVAAISMTRSPNGALSLRTVNRMLDRAEMLAKRPVLQ